MLPILNPSPTSLPIPSLWVIPVHQPQASCILHRTWTGDSFLIWYYTCFNAIFPNHPTLPLPQSPKDCSIHLCLFCCLAYIRVFSNESVLCISWAKYWSFSFSISPSSQSIFRTWKQPRCPSADKWIRMLWYIYIMEYYSAIKKSTFESVLMRWMKLEPIIQSEVSQKEKHQYSILTHIYGI